MSIEQKEPEVESAETKPPETQAPETKPRPKDVPEDQGWDRVEMDEKVQKRFNRVYQQVKQYERVMDEVTGDNRKLVERLDAMEKKAADRESRDRAAKLRADEKTALEEGDYARASAVRDEITDMKVEAKIPKKTEEEKPPPKWLTPERETQLADWAGAVDDNGNLLRPWVHPDHEDHKTALHAAQVIIEKNPNVPMDELLAEIERVNGRVAKRPSAPVLSSGGDVRPKPAKKTDLTNDQKLIARRMYPKDPNALERYSKAMEKYS
jgi:hypothetical protein